MKQRLRILWVTTLVCVFSPSSYAQTDYVQGTMLSDRVFYQIGGGAAIMPPAIRKKPHELGIGIGWKANLMCGNFDFKTTIKNQLNGVTEGFKDLYSNIIQSATGAVASLPAMIIQRANPQLYDILTNGMYQAKLDFDSLKTNCEEMSAKLADAVLDNQWIENAKLENYKSIASSEKDAKKAKKKSETENGDKGLTWVGGQKKGGAGQKPIELVKDVVEAGYNLGLQRSPLDKSAVNDKQCDGLMCKEWKTPEEASTWVKEVLGDKTISTCESCDNKPKATAGTGLSPKIEKETIQTTTELEQVLNSDTLNAQDLANLSSSTVVVTRGLIEALRDDPDAVVLATRLAQEIAISKVLEKALSARRLILAGMREPNVAASALAQKEMESELVKLDRDIEQIKMELELQTLFNKTSLTVFQNQAILKQNALENNSPDDTNFDKTTKPKGTTPELNNGNFKSKDQYIKLPIPDTTGSFERIRGRYVNNYSGSSSSGDLSRFESKDAYADGRATVYRNAEGKLVRREGGSLAWRNNNPGNIRMGEWAKANGAIGVGPSGFAIFPDAETGRRAIHTLLREGKNYRNNTIAGVIETYAPRNENNTDAYIAAVTRQTGLSAEARMNTLTESERESIVNAITRIEGWKEGSERNLD